MRKIVFELAGLDVDDEVPELGQTVGDALLTPTHLYTDTTAAALAAGGEAVTGIAHITGGGLVDNVERLLPAGCRADIDRAAWQPPNVFTWLQRLGDVETEEMFRVFNMGIGLVLIVRPEGVRRVAEALAKSDPGVRPIGAVVEHGAG